MIEFHFFGMPIKTLGLLGKIRVGRVTGNKHNFFFCLSTNNIGFYEDLKKVIFQLSSNTHLIFSSEYKQIFT